MGEKTNIFEFYAIFVLAQGLFAFLIAGTVESILMNNKFMPVDVDKNPSRHLSVSRRAPIA